MRGVIESRTCLLPMITPQSSFLLRMYRHYEKNVMPTAGGILDQANYYVDAMEHIAAISQGIMAERLEQQRRDANHGSERHNLAQLTRQ